MLMVITSNTKNPYYNMTPIYPTKEEILKEHPNFEGDTIKIILDWKKKHIKNWNKISSKKKIGKLYGLIMKLTNETVHIKTKGERYYYNPQTRTIHCDTENPSIISTLHEISHHLNGNSELTACRWSVWLFKICFPVSYEKLEWKNHLLIKK